jgi:hypothetical protein
MLKMPPKYDWDELGFDPTKDGYWATSEKIKERILEKESQARKASLITFLVLGGCALFLGFIVYLFI